MEEDGHAMQLRASGAAGRQFRAVEIDWRGKASWVRDQPVSPTRRNATEGSLSATQSLPARIEKDRGHDPRPGALPLDGMDRDHLAALPGEAAFEEAERDISSET